MRVEVNDPGLLEDLREYLQSQGCPTEKRTPDTCDVRVLVPAGVDRSDADDRLKIFRHLREWCADHPGARANILG